MSAINDGGPAFPIPFDPQGDIDPPMGMSLRDWFAGMALSGLYGDSEFEGSHVDAAKCCYSAADAMLSARDRKQQA